MLPTEILLYSDTRLQVLYNGGVNFPFGQVHSITFVSLRRRSGKVLSLEQEDTSSNNKKLGFFNYWEVAFQRGWCSGVSGLTTKSVMAIHYWLNEELVSISC